MTMLAVICSLILAHMCVHANCANMSEFTDLDTQCEVVRFASMMDLYSDTDLQHALHCGCRDNRCECCLNRSFRWSNKKHHLYYCVSLEVLVGNKFRIKLTSNSRKIFSVTVRVFKSITPCVHIPGVPPSVARACLGLYNIDMKERRICAKVIIKILWKKNTPWDFGCFHYPRRNGDRLLAMNSGEFLLDVDMEAELESRDLD